MFYVSFKVRNSFQHTFENFALLFVHEKKEQFVYVRLETFKWIKVLFFPKVFFTFVMNTIKKTYEKLKFT